MRFDPKKIYIYTYTPLLPTSSCNIINQGLVQLDF